VFVSILNVPLIRYLTKNYLLNLVRMILMVYYCSGLDQMSNILQC